MRIVLFFNSPLKFIPTGVMAMDQAFFPVIVVSIQRGTRRASGFACSIRRNVLVGRTRWILKNGSNLSVSFQSGGGYAITIQSGFSSKPNVSLGSGGGDDGDSFFETTCLIMASPFKLKASYSSPEQNILKRAWKSWGVHGGIKP